MHLAVTATSAHTFHGSCKVLSPNPKTQLSKCQNCGLWSPQSTGVRLASISSTPRDTTLSPVKSIPLGICPLPQVQTRDLFSLLTLILQRGTPNNLLRQVESCLPSGLVRCVWKYSNLAGIKSLSSNKDSYYIPLKTLTLSTNLYKIFSDYLWLNKLTVHCSSDSCTISLVINHMFPCDSFCVFSSNWC